jgi:hypothetical protein
MMRNILSDWLNLIRSSLGFAVFCYSSLSLSALDSDWPPPYKFEYDITKVPPQHTQSFLKATEAWNKLLKAQDAFYKAALLSGDTAPLSYHVSVDHQLSAFIHPWDMDSEYPFLGGYGSGQELTNFKGYKEIKGLGNIEGSLEAIFTSGLNYEQFMSEKNSTHIHIKRDAGDVTLLLSADRNADWDISWDKGVVIKKIILVNSWFHQRIKTQSPVDNIIKTQSKIAEDYLFNNENRDLISASNLKDYIERIKSSVGAKPRNIRFYKAEKNIEIDGSALLLAEKTNSHLELSNDINYKKQTELGSTSFATIKTSDDKWTGQYLNIEDNRNSGKWYWEAEFRELKPVTDSNGEFYLGVRSDYKSQASPEMPIMLTSVIKKGDVVRFLLDFDNSRFYVGLNQVWVVGNPNFLESGIKLNSEYPYTPHMHLRFPHSDEKVQGELIANFGVKPFKFLMPENYQPYDAKNSIKQNDYKQKYNKPYSLRSSDLDIVKLSEKSYKRTRKGFKEALKEFLPSIIEFRDAACSLTAEYRYKKSTNKQGEFKLDPQCVLFVKGFIEYRSSLPTEDGYK